VPRDRHNEAEPPNAAGRIAENGDVEAAGDGKPSAEERVAAMGQLLLVCRRYYLTMFEGGLLTPQPDSAAAHFLGVTESGPAGDWPAEAASQPATLAAKLVRQQSDYLVAIGTLLLADEVFDPIMTLLRGAFEYGARAAWLMDPTVRHRVRCTRAVLTEVVSLELSRRAAGRMPETPARAAARTAGRAKWRELGRVIDARFTAVQRADSGVDWVIEGVTYPSWTALGDIWAKLAGAPVDGAGLYDLLSVGAHPQGFLATAGFFRTDDGGISRQVDVDELAKRAQLAVVSFYVSLTAVANYNGYESDLMTELEGRIEAVFPNVWNGDPPP
jgi:hypothetical protein